VKHLRILSVAAVSVLALAACSKSGADKQAAAGQAPAAGASAQPTSGPDTVIAEADAPRLKAGEWRRVESDGSGPAQTTTYCESGKPLNFKHGAENCQKVELKRTFTGGLVMNLACKSKGVDMTMHANVTGDFNSHVSSDISSTIAMAGQPPQSVSGHTELTYLGPCGPGEKPDEE
jgi:hypothetical protein